MFVILAEVNGRKLYYSGAWQPVLSKRSAKRFTSRESAEERLAGILRIDFGDGPGASLWQKNAKVLPA